MNKKLRVLFLLIICSCSEDPLHKIPFEDRFDFELSLIENNFSKEHVEIRLDSVNGPVITEDSLFKLHPENLGFDYYVNSDNELKVTVARRQEPADYLLQKRLDSLFTWDTPFLIKSLKADNLDSIEIAKVVSHYEYNKPFVSYSVDCDHVRFYLEEAYKTDQGVRNGEINSSMEEVDKANQDLLYSIIQCCGANKIVWAGDEATQAAFLIAQHAPLEFQLEFIELFRSWSKEGIIAPSTFALMVDRVRLKQGKTQLYGTQVTTDDSGVSKLSPVDDLDKVRARRDSLFMEPLEEYLLRFNIIL